MKRDLDQLIRDLIGIVFDLTGRPGAHSQIALDGFKRDAEELRDRLGELEPAQPEQPRGEEARVEKCRCGFPFYEDRFTIPRLDGGSVPDAWEFCPYCGGRLDEPAQPQPRGEGDAGKTRGYTREDIQANTWWPGKGGEGDDLAARLEALAQQHTDAAYGGSIDTQDEHLAAAHAFREAAQLARASTHPEQSDRVDPEQLRLVRNMAKIEASQSDPEQAPAFTDKRRASHRRRADALNAVLAALEPASPTPTEQENDR